ncbi:MAG: hypothetical protein ACJ71Y_16625 [Blastococcus sp.]
MHIRQPADVLTVDHAVQPRLPGGWVTTAWGTKPHRVVRALGVLVAVPA